jgi:hypothetical protein
VYVATALLSTIRLYKSSTPTFATPDISVASALEIDKANIDVVVRIFLKNLFVRVIMHPIMLKIYYDLND